MTRYPTVEETIAVHAKRIAQFGGNKRVAVTMTAAFLRVNGHRLEFSDADAFLFLTDLYETGRLRFQELDRWLRQHVVAAADPTS